MVATRRPEISDQALECLAEAAQILQSYFQEHGQEYTIETLETALGRWIEGTIEDIASDAPFHAATGRDDIAINRRAFMRALQSSQNNGSKSFPSCDRPTPATLESGPPVC